MLLCVVLGGGLMTSCNLPNDESFQRYDSSNLPQVITNTTTTTTTTTTIAPTTTTLAPEATIPPSVPSIPPSSAPTNPVTERVLYLTVGFEEKMKRYPVVLLEPVTVDAMIAELESPPPLAADQNLRTALRPALVNSVRVGGGIATVDLNGTELSVLSEKSKRRAIGQMVLTLTSFTSPDRGGIGQVVFTLDGDPIPVLLPRTGFITQPGDPVTFEDFAPLIVPDDVVTDTVVPAPSTPTSSPPGSSAPVAPSVVGTTTPP